MKVLRLVFRGEARDDVDEIAHHIAGDNVEAAKRFFVVIDKLCDLLMHTPDIGSKRIFQHEGLQGMRAIPLHNFENYLVFYRADGDTVEILRVIHGARDYPVPFQ